jgi:tRNA A37 threonylcarbamoyladenosine synthetase subunit TsaC/SUA5/YrdC
MIDYSAILLSYFANDIWTLNGDDYEGLTWISNTSKPTKKQLEDLWPATLTAIEEKKAKTIADKQAILDRLGITAEEIALLLR